MVCPNSYWQSYDHLLAKPSPPCPSRCLKGWIMTHVTGWPVATPSTLLTNRYSINTNTKHKHAVETQTQKRCPPTYSINTLQMEPHAQRTRSAFVLRSICKRPQKFATRVWENNGLHYSTFTLSIRAHNLCHDNRQLIVIAINRNHSASKINCN